jgi:hypothetical protein
MLALLVFMLASSSRLFNAPGKPLLAAIAAAQTNPAAWLIRLSVPGSRLDRLQSGQGTAAQASLFAFGRCGFWLSGCPRRVERDGRAASPS